ncbi:penicillin-binding protein [Mangrovactinospora gilvigrisea]|uniref:Penicillin-binding protein n=1 Tax=Mangrovactinospora gilvigrisea TaxID=1428644 RepID=A0A1J7C6P4_9ACTN|nr:penicillin-binding transpeptidase domain-containing protein [Mangrovactinospora gilvigrisea]OIV37204.1 penicillin-binding protein [Mangrovactinospora gilvigrisea]
MLRPARRTALFCLVLLVLLLLGCARLQVLQANSLDDNPANRRQTIARYSRPRGNILVDGNTVTGSRATTGQLKYERTYTDGPLWSPVTGYASQAYGTGLLEGVEDDVLAGTDPRLSRSSLWAELTRKQNPGGNVFTAINGKAQRAAYQALGGKKGAVAAIDPRNGHILALVTSPSYDPGRFAGTDSASEQAWKALNADPAKPMLNRAIRETYPPGSTFKIVTAVAALQSGVVTDIDAATDTPDPYTLPGTSTKLTNEAGGCKNASLRVALEKSCNTVFAHLAVDVGQSRMRETANAFGFNDAALDMPVRVAQSLYPKVDYPSQVALSGIGQGSDTATPLQMAMVAAAVADGGNLERPQLLDKLATSDGRTVSSTSASTYHQVMDSSTASEMQSMMQDVVNSGTGTNAQISGAVVGGKTGTAQHGENNVATPYAWFVSYAKPSAGAESPVAVAVIVEDGSANRADISGGGLAAPVAKAVMEAVLNG